MALGESDRVFAMDDDERVYDLPTQNAPGAIKIQVAAVAQPIIEAIRHH
jgi:hypothetical protein